MLHVVSDEFPADTAERLVDGCDLREDVGTVSLLLHHPLESPHLPLDPPQSFEVPFLRVGFHGHRVSAFVANPTGIRCGVRDDPGISLHLSCLDDRECRPSIPPRSIPVGRQSSLTV